MFTFKAKWVLSLMLAALMLTGCSSTPPVKIELTGTPGTPITGYYIRNNKRVELHDTLPQTIELPGVSQIAVRKLNKQDSLTAQARSPNGSYMSTGSPAGNDNGVRLHLTGGFSSAVIFPDESLDPPETAVMTISPYWYEPEKTWAFDDTRAGLTHETFIRGVPEMVSILVKDIPNAKTGFRLSFSAHPFLGYQKKLHWVRAEEGGNYYRSDDPPAEGWLCPQLFRYFTHAPRDLYVCADPRT